MQTVFFSVMSPAFSHNAARQYIQHVSSSAHGLARCTALGLVLVAFALPSYATTPRAIQSDARQEQVHYECGVFIPQAIDATYQYNESSLQQVTLRYQDKTLILPYIKRHGRVLTFISQRLKWEVDYPHPAVPGPLDNGRLYQRQLYQVKGRLMTVERPLVRECMVYPHVATRG